MWNVKSNVNNFPRALKQSKRIQVPKRSESVPIRNRGVVLGELDGEHEPERDEIDEQTVGERERKYERDSPVAQKHMKTEWDCRGS